TKEKPVGTIWIAVADEEGVVTKRLSYSKSRDLNIKYTAIALLNLIRLRITGKQINQ
ncbi:MAG: CinA family protein, partial [Cyclobacteriaceae bacterium]